MARGLFINVSADESLGPAFTAQDCFAGTQYVDTNSPHGPRSRVAPAAPYALKELLARLGDATFDFLFVKGAHGGTSFPRNLHLFAGTKILYLGDTYSENALAALIRYAQAEPFDRIVAGPCRHHLQAFAAAGFDNLAWIPGLCTGKPEPRTGDIPVLAFAGPKGPQRLPLRDAALRLGVDIHSTGPSPLTVVTHLSGELPDALFTAALDGSTLLLQDPHRDSGLTDCFTPGEHLLTFDSPETFARLLQELQANPARAQAIGAAAKEHFDGSRLRAHLEALCSNAPLPFAVPVASAHADPSALPLAQWLETLARQAREVHLFAQELLCLPFVPTGVRIHNLEALVDPAITAPGFSILRNGLPQTQHLLALPTDVSRWPKLLAAFRGSYLLAPAGQDTAPLADWGFEPLEETSLPLHGCTNALRFVEKTAATGNLPAATAKLAAFARELHDPEALGIAATLALALQDEPLHRSLLLRRASINRADTGALLSLAQHLDTHSEPEPAALIFREAARSGELSGNAATRHEQLWAGDLSPAQREIQELCNPLPTRANQPQRILVVAPRVAPQGEGHTVRALQELIPALRARGHHVELLTTDDPASSTLPDPLLPYPEACTTRVDILDAEALCAALQSFDPTALLLAEFSPLSSDILPAAEATGLPIFVWGKDAPYPRLNEGLACGVDPRTWFRYLLPAFIFPRLLYVGPCDYDSGLGTCFDALGVLTRTGRNFAATILGPQPDLNVIAQMTSFAEGQGFADRVSFLTSTSATERRRLYATHDVLLLPATDSQALRPEIHEARLGGLVAIASNAGPCAADIACGTDGLTFTAKNAHSLAAAIESLYADPSRAQALASAGQARALACAPAAATPFFESHFASQPLPA